MDKIIFFSSLLGKLENTSLTEAEEKTFVSLWNDLFGDINKKISKPEDVLYICKK